MPWGWEAAYFGQTLDCGSTYGPMFGLLLQLMFSTHPQNQKVDLVSCSPKQICRFGPYHDWRSSTEGLTGSIDAHHPILATYHARNHVFPLFMALLIPWVIAEATDTMPKSASFAVDSQHQTRYV